jgi:dynactin 1
MEEMRAAIEDLEALKELSDEIEETHVETEKALQEEIGAVATTIAGYHHNLF